MATSPIRRLYKRAVNLSAAFVLALSSVAFLPQSTAKAAPAPFCSAGTIKTFDTNFNWTFKDWGWGNFWSNWTGSETQTPVTVSVEGTGGNWWGTPTLPDGPDSDSNWNISVSSAYELAGVRADYGRSGVKELAASGQSAVVDGSRGYKLQTLDVCVKQLDTTPPVISYTLNPAPNANGWNSTDTYLDWTVIENESPVTLQGCNDKLVTTEGTTQFTCGATSMGGSSSQVATVKIDKTKPVIGYSIDPTTPTNGNVTVNFTCSDSGSGVAVNSLASQVVAVNGTFYSGDGCIDNAGNVANSINVTVSNIDKSVPALSNISLAPMHNGNIGRTVTVTFDLNDTTGVDLSRTKVLFSDGANDSHRAKESAKYSPIHVSGNTYQVVIDTTNFVDINYTGKYNLAFNLYDVLGNHSSSKPSSFRGILIDNSGPSSSLGSPVSGSILGGTQRFTFSLNDDTGVASAYAKFNGASTKQYNLIQESGNIWFVDVDTSELQDGDYSIDVRPIDLFGTPRYGKNIAQVKIDNTAPIVSVNSLSTTDTTPLITGLVDDDTATIKVTIDGVEYDATNNGDGTWQYQVLSPLALGTYNVTASANDGLNDSAPASANVTISAVPASPAVLPANTQSNNQSNNFGILADSTVAPDNGEDVLGEQTPKNEDDQDVAGTSDVQTDDEDQAGEIFGLAWYWWLAILAALAALWWLIAAYLRRRQEQEA